MKDVLIQFGKVFVVAICCVGQLIALIFAGIALMFDKIAEVLSGGAAGVTKKLNHSDEEEEISEEVPAES